MELEERDDADLKKSRRNLLQWVIGIIFILVGSIEIQDMLFAGLVNIIVGLLLIPPLFKWLFGDRLSFLNSVLLKWGIGLSGIVIFIIVIPIDQESDIEEANSLVKIASRHIQSGEVESSIKKIEEAKELYPSSQNKAVDFEDVIADTLVNDALQYIQKGYIVKSLETLNRAKELYSSTPPRVIRLQDKIQQSQSFDKVEQTLLEMSDEEFAQLNNSNLDKEFFQNQALNEIFYKSLKKHSDKRDELIAARDEQRKEEKRRERALREQARKEKIESHFSEWDNSHRGLVEAVKNRMHDPSSFKHVETRYSDRGDHLLVLMKFRGTNAFGGVVTQIVRAHCDLEGNVEEILSIN